MEKNGESIFTYTDERVVEREGIAETKNKNHHTLN